MKYFLIVYINLVGVKALLSQDIIYTINKQKIEASIREISSDGVSYKYFNDTDTNSSAFI